jgi:hypothetical protein
LVALPYWPLTASKMLQSTVQDRPCSWAVYCVLLLGEQVVDKVRGNLSKLERKTLSALIVIDVHARDITAELANQGVDSEADFEWISQLR